MRACQLYVCMYVRGLETRTMDREEEERVARERRTSQLVGHRKVSRNAFSAFLNDVMATVCVPRINMESLRVHQRFFNWAQKLVNCILTERGNNEEIFVASSCWSFVRQKSTFRGVSSTLKQQDKKSISIFV